MFDTLSEIPLWLPAGLVLLGVVLLVMGNNRIDRAMKAIGVALLAAAALLGLMSYLMESDREQVERKTRATVAAIEARDWDAFRLLLHPEVGVFAWRGPEGVADAAQRAMERLNMRDIRIARMSTTDSRGAVADPSITSTIQVVTDNSVTNWELEWEKFGDEWLLYDVQALGGLGIGAGALEGIIRSRGGS